MHLVDERPVVRVRDRSYEWIEEWPRWPQTEARRRAWPHTAIVALSNDQLVTFESADASLAVLDSEGRPMGSVPVAIGEAHGITRVVDGNREVLWLADASGKRSAAADYNTADDDSSSRVVRVELDGRTTMTLERPPHPAYEKGKYRPTCVTVDVQASGGSGEIWVGDGYGESYVHHFDRGGRYLGSLSGEEGAGRFNIPHAVYIDRRRAEPELYVADRSNARIQVYGLDGQFHRAISGFLSRPTWIAPDGDGLVVVEFNPPRLTLLDAEDHLIGYLAEGPVIIDRPGWPNELDPDGKPVRPSLIPGKLNSPHTVAVDSSGNFYVSEYLIGSRLPKLRRQA